jgi:hypothetical protein
VFGNKVPKRKPGLRRDRERKWQELHNLYILPNITTMAKSKKMKWWNLQKELENKKFKLEEKRIFWRHG